MDLNKIYDGNLFWDTGDYSVIRNEEIFGYAVRNNNTGQHEFYADTELSAVMAALSLQDSYTEDMQDPVRTYKSRKQRLENGMPQSNLALKSKPH